MENNRLVFQLTPKQLKLKNLLSKDFLELEIWAISDILPNDNKTHFTLEGMQESLPTFKNKPILGFFDKGDFVEHNGQMAYDRETDSDYWDTEHGERILGFIRESDTVEIVKQGDLNWIRFTCVLCVQYCYKQVKRLLKDKSKKVSVEISVLDSEMKDGIEYIYKFNLLGTTILGSKNGVPIREGIPNAHLSLLNQLDEDKLERQQQALCFAYKEIEGAKASSKSNNQNKKEEEAQKMIQKEELKQKLDSFLSQYTYDSNGESVFKYEVKDFTDECVYAYSKEANECLKFAYSINDESDVVVDVSNALSMSQEEIEKYSVAPAENVSVKSEYELKIDELTTKCEEWETTAQQYQNKCQEYECKCEEYEQKCGEYEKKCEEYEQRCCEYTAQIAQMQEKIDSCQDYESIKCELAQLKEEKFKAECDRMKSLACKMMEEDAVSEEDRKAIEMKCETGEYACQEDMVKEIAYAIYKANGTKVQTNKNNFSVPIAFEDKGVKSDKNKTQLTRESRLKNYAAGKNNF